jgi:glutathione synthase/RimK-type ligase-like ATP-grasp enzyme
VGDPHLSSKYMKIILATCDEKLSGTDDDQILRLELCSSGHQVEFKSWTESHCDWSAADLVLVRSTWDYHLRKNEFLDWARLVTTQTRLLNSADVLVWNSSKEYLLEIEKLGCPIVSTEISRDLDQCLLAVRSLLNRGDSVILKPAVSATAALTFWIRDINDAKTCLERILFKSPALIQAFVKSIQGAGEVSLIFFRIDQSYVFSHAVRKIPAPLDFRVQADFGGIAERFEATKKLIQLARDTLSKLAFHVVYARVDIVEFESDPKISELELIEPELFFRLSSNSAELFAKAIAT